MNAYVGVHLHDSRGLSMGHPPHQNYYKCPSVEKEDVLRDL